MSDLIERLRVPVAYGPVGAQKERDEAADEIERLKTRLSALADVANIFMWHQSNEKELESQIEMSLAELDRKEQA